MLGLESSLKVVGFSLLLEVSPFLKTLKLLNANSIWHASPVTMALQSSQKPGKLIKFFVLLSFYDVQTKLNVAYFSTNGPSKHS